LLLDKYSFLLIILIIGFVAWLISIYFVGSIGRKEMVILIVGVISWYGYTVLKTNLAGQVRERIDKNV
tara:strand:+ start:2876 stop:3079 length:204 start_codon:yes stop_codon:yes gene_type:complete